MVQNYPVCCRLMNTPLFDHLSHTNKNWIFEMFSFTQLAQNSKGSGSWMALACEFLADLTKVPWEIFRLSPSLQKESIQFRYNFSPQP